VLFWVIAGGVMLSPFGGSQGRVEWYLLPLAVAFVAALWHALRDGPVSASKPKPLLVGLLAAGATAVLCAAAAAILINTGTLGHTLFALLPFVTGFAFAMAAYPKITSGLTLVLLAPLVLLGLLGLLAFKLEGLLCCLMSLPIIAPGIVLGALLGILIRRWFKQSGRGMGLLGVNLAALLLLAGHNIEQAAAPAPRTETVVTSVRFDASPEAVWNQLKAMDRVAVEKHWLMKAGLPVPVACRLDRDQERVGGTRTCYFERGSIEETITIWDPPRRMRFNIVRSGMPGRHWLGFRDAEYVLEPDSTGTRVSRSTLITSQLRPAWYWRRMERMGVDTEHRYIFEHVRRALAAGSP
jgi:hypothetical protein